MLEPALGPNSVLTLDDAPHMRQRKLLLPPFHGERVQRYGELIVEMTRREMESWPVGEPFAMRPHTQRITLAVIMRAVFGVHDEDRLARFEVLIDDFARRVGLITSLPAPAPQPRPLQPLGRFVRSREALDAFIYEEIALRRAEPGYEERDDVLSLLLGARDEDGEPMSDARTARRAGHRARRRPRDDRDRARLGGRAAASATPAVLAKLRDSLAAGEEDYLGATVKETLRSRPVIVDVARKLTAPATIGGYELPAGTFVLPAIAALHYREDIFPEPHEFRPERFLDAKADNYAWIPFGGGVRRCIGAAFAEYEMRTILREFVERADLRAADPKPERVKIRNITLVPAKGARVVLERRARRPSRLARLGLLGLLDLGFLPFAHSSSSTACFGLGVALVRALGAGRGSTRRRGRRAPPRPRAAPLRPLDPLLQPRRLLRRLLRPAWWRCTCRRPSPGPSASPAAARRRPRARRGGAGTRPSRWVAAQLAVLADEGAAADRLEQGAVVGDEDDRALVLDQRVLERLAALDVEVVGGLVEDQDVGAGGDQDRQREPPLLAAGDVAELLLGVVAGEEEAAEQRPRLRPG